MSKLQKKVSVKDIAQKLGCSLSTVNKALTGKPGVSERRRREIQMTAREMGYEVNSVAQVMSRRPITIGVVMPEMPNDSYFNVLKEGMDEEFARLEKYRVNSAYYMVTDEQTGNDVEGFMNWVKEKEVEAICYCPALMTKSGKLLKWITDHKIPLFLSGGGIEPPEECITVVSVDSRLSGKLTADFFHCIHGEDIHAVVSLESFDTVSQWKKAAAFSERLQEYGLTDVTVLQDQNNEGQAMDLICELFEVRPDINCLYVTTGISLSVSRYLHENGLSDKVTLVCTDFTENIRPYVMNNTVKAIFLQNQNRVGRIAVRGAYDYLIRTRTFGNEDWQPPKRVYVDPSFCLKASFEEV